MLGNIAHTVPQFVALDGDVVAGWCDICPMDKDTLKHSGILGRGVIAGHRPL